MVKDGQTNSEQFKSLKNELFKDDDYDFDSAT